MGTFPRLINPLTPGGLQSSALQQKPIDLSGILEGMQKDRLAKAAAPKASKKGAADKYEIVGLEGAIDQAQAAKIQGQNEMADYINRYGDLAFSLPQYKQSDAKSTKYYTEEFNEKRRRDKEMHDSYMKQLQEIDSTGTAPMTLYNLGELQKGSVETQARSVERLRNLGVDEKGTDAYKVYAHNWNTAQKAADAILDPAFAAVNSYGSEDVKRFALDGDNVAGILKVGSSKSSNHSAMEVARAELYQDAGFHLDDKGNYIWRPTNTENPLQAGLLQEALKTLNVEGNEYFMKKDGSYDLEKIYEEGAKFAHNKLKLAVNKRLKQAEDNTKSYTQPTESEYGFARQQAAVLAELAGPKYEMPKTYAVEDFVYSEDQIRGLLGFNNSATSGSVLGPTLDYIDQNKTIQEYVASGVFIQEIDPSSGNPVYRVAPDADNNLNKIIDEKNKTAPWYDVAGLVKTQERLRLQNIAAAAPATKINVAQNHEVYIQTANELQKHIAPRYIGQPGEVYAQGRVIDIGGTLGVFDLTGFEVESIGNQVMTANGATATNWQVEKPFLVNGKIVTTTGFGDYDEKAKAFIQKPAEYKTDQNGHITRLTEDDRTGQFSDRTRMSEENKDNATGMTVNPYDMWVPTSMKPVDKNHIDNWASKTKIQKSIEVPIIVQRSYYQAEYNEAAVALSNAKVVVPNSGKFSSPTSGKTQNNTAQENANLQKYFDDNKFTADQRQVVLATQDIDAAARIAKLNKSGQNKKYPTSPLMASVPVKDPITGKYDQNVVSEKTVMEGGKPITKYVVTVLHSAKSDATGLAAQASSGNVNGYRQYYEKAFKETTQGGSKITPQEAEKNASVYGAFGRLKPNK